MSLYDLKALSDLIAEATQEPVSSIVSARGLTGGSIHHVQWLELADGRAYCVKCSRQAGDMFAQEATGLAALAQAGCLQTPRVIAVASLPAASGRDYVDCLVMQAITSAPRSGGYWEQLGTQLAEHHRHSGASAFGWSSDNYIGSNLQKNESRPTWAEFFGQMRLAYQLRLARQRGLGSGQFYRLADRLVERIDRWLGDRVVVPCLLHGDLWSGNVLVGPAGQPVVIDPAVYYGDREAELAMPGLFGSFPPQFYDAYEDTWPLDEGWQERVELYKLYHLLNHLNLFGSGYLESCMEIVQRFAL